MSQEQRSVNEFFFRSTSNSNAAPLHVQAFGLEGKDPEIMISVPNNTGTPVYYKANLCVVSGVIGNGRGSVTHFKRLYARVSEPPIDLALAECGVGGLERFVPHFRLDGTVNGEVYLLSLTPQIMLAIATNGPKWIANIKRALG